MALYLPMVQKDVFGGPPGTTRNASLMILQGILQGMGKRKATEQNNLLSGLFAGQQGGGPTDPRDFANMVIQNPALTPETKNRAMKMASDMSTMGVQQSTRRLHEAQSKYYENRPTEKQSYKTLYGKTKDGKWLSEEYQAGQQNVAKEKMAAQGATHFTDKAPSTTETSWQRATEEYLDPKTGIKWAQDYDYNPKTRERVDVGKPRQVGASDKDQLKQKIAEIRATTTTRENVLAELDPNKRNAQIKLNLWDKYFKGTPLSTPEKQLIGVDKDYIGKSLGMLAQNMDFLMEEDTSKKVKMVLDTAKTFRESMEEEAKAEGGGESATLQSELENLKNRFKAGNQGEKGQVQTTGKSTGPQSTRYLDGTETNVRSLTEEEVSKYALQYIGLSDAKKIAFEKRFRPENLIKIKILAKRSSPAAEYQKNQEIIRNRKQLGEPEPGARVYYPGR